MDRFHREDGLAPNRMRRILDVAALFKASYEVATKHVAFRSHQLEAYNKTSSLARAVRSQTDRITLTVRAASDIAERFNGTGTEYPAQSAKQDVTVTAASVPGRGNVGKAIPFRKGDEDGRQESFDVQYPNNINPEPFSHANEKEKGLKATSPSQTGSCSLEGYGSDSFPSTKESDTESIPEAHSRNPRKSFVGQKYELGEQSDVGLPSKTRSTEPAQRARPLPTEDAQISQRQAEKQTLPQVVEPIDSRSHAISQVQAVQEQEQLPEEAYKEIFHSPRVARMLCNQSSKDQKSKDLDLPGAMSATVEQTKYPHETDHDSSGLTIPVRMEDGNLDCSDSAAQNVDIGEKDDSEKVLPTDRAKDAVAKPSSSVDDQKNSQEETAHNPFEMRESRVPSSRFGRIWQYGGLAASMTFGAAGESFRRITGSGSKKGSSLMLSAGNMERLVAKLSRMRGAALKLGQMMSFQDSKMLPKQFNEVLQRVQDSADYMPASQRNQVLASNLGADWSKLFSSFNEKPMAAASIGQVHSAILASSGQRVAVKVQYPGVASSIDSDLSNLSILLTASRLLPKGLYLDKTIANARTELAWECDYIREAEMGERFRQLLADETDIFHVPQVMKEASGPQVLTAEFCEGVGVTKVQNFTQEQKDWIGTHILRLCLREISEFKFMQTDPNWTNFLFNAQTDKLELLDFGASRDYPDKFILPYTRTLLAASRSDRTAIRDLSIQLGYLTGHESQAMLNAHVDSVLTLAEPFMDSAPEVYDFRDQTITERVRGFIPVMVRERLAPPPEETYSLHRKLSGAFLLCARLGSRVRCREMFRDAMAKAGLV